MAASSFLEQDIHGQTYAGGGGLLWRRRGVSGGMWMDGWHSGSTCTGQKFELTTEFFAGERLRPGRRYRASVYGGFLADCNGCFTD